MKATNFSKNLRVICDRHRSVAQVCRELGINRQQFNKYLSGKSAPSAYNLSRIGEYFRFDPHDFFLPSDEFAERLQVQPGRSKPYENGGPNLAFSGAFAGQSKVMSRYLGFYHIYSYTPAWKGHVIKFLTHVYAQDGLVWVKSIHRFVDPQKQISCLCKYVGHACFLNDRIFVVQHAPVANDVIIQTIVHPPQERRLSVLQGYVFPMDFKSPHAYSSQIALQFLGTSIDIKQEMRNAGVVPADSPTISPRIRRTLGPEPDFPERVENDAVR